MTPTEPLDLDAIEKRWKTIPANLVPYLREDIDVLLAECRRLRGEAMALKFVAQEDAKRAADFLVKAIAERDRALAAARELRTLLGSEVVFDRPVWERKVMRLLDATAWLAQEK